MKNNYYGDDYDNSQAVYDDYLEYQDALEEAEDEYYQNSPAGKTLKIITGIISFGIVVAIVTSYLPNYKEHQKVKAVTNTMKSYSLADEYNIVDLYNDFDLDFTPSDSLIRFLSTTKETIEFCTAINTKIESIEKVEIDEDEYRALERKEKDLEFLINELKTKELKNLSTAILDYVKDRCMDSLSEFDPETFKRQNFSRVILSTNVEEGSRNVYMTLYEKPYEGCSYDKEAYRIKIKDPDMIDCMNAWTRVDALMDKDFDANDKKEITDATDILLKAIATISVNDEASMQIKETNKSKGTNIQIIKSKK